MIKNNPRLSNQPLDKRKTNVLTNLIKKKLEGLFMSFEAP